MESGSRLRHEFSKLGPFVRSMLRNVLASRRLSGILSVVNHLEQIPNAESRVILSDQKDELGVSQLQVHWRIAQCERESLIALHKLLKEKFALHGVGSFESDLDPPSGVWPVSTDAAHHIGTTRMHRDPKRGVTDANCRVHGIQNLFISGSSVFPTSGYANPTLTIVALAVRLAAHLKAIYAEHHPVKAVSSMPPPRRDPPCLGSRVALWASRSAGGDGFAFLRWIKVSGSYSAHLGACRSIRSGFERPFFRLAASGCIDDRTDIACFAVFARRNNCSLSGRRRNSPTGS